jgi:hypothetical protein
VTVQEIESCNPKPFVIKVLNLSSLKTRFCEIRFFEIRAQQGFWPFRNKKNHAGPDPAAQNARIARCPPNFILMEKSTLRAGGPII